METSFNTVLALTIKQKREEQKLTQAQVAELMGMTSAGWGKIENGQATLSIDNIYKFCQLKEINIDVSSLINLAELRVKELTKAGWSVGTLPKREDDKLLWGYTFDKSLSSNLKVKAAFLGVAAVSPALGGIISAAVVGAELAGKFFEKKDDDSSDK
ncbi:helix-turn-helix domain-containing protein [Shewanella mangrovi]|uniref:helix-turn-helix domain-containing protein n=1 Tax=Shewanella mangrovi TaxID=1515746 RepID=UPI00068E861C|nr:helix-turn-helix transcriptional regulator [Shewanella mangrovi]